MSDTQGIDVGLAIAKARLNEATNWHQFGLPKHDDDSWCCKREQELRDEVDTLTMTDPRKDLAAPVEERRISQWPAVSHERREKPYAYPLEQLVEKWAAIGARNIMELAYEALAETKTYRTCAAELEQRLAEMRGAKR